MRYHQDNIVAVATATGYAGIGVIRVSGINLSPLVTQLCHKDNLKPRYAHYGDYYDHAGAVIDSGLIIYFPAPNSFTGEEVLELQGHGSPVVLNMLLKRCLELGCRMAEAGEFTRRAYLNGKIDLVQAESIADLIHAESEAEAKGALKSLHGEFSQQIGRISERLINLRMFVEATLDFPEEDLEFIANAKIRDKLAVVQQEIHNLLGTTQQGVILNNGADIVIVGRPNVGKSSLLNALANEEVAIVTDIAGTTRDIVRQKIIIDGIPFNIIDTAGIRVTQDVVEKIGIERALQAAASADLAMILIDDSIGMSEEDRRIIDQLPANLPRLYLHNKIDLSGGAAKVMAVDGETNIYLSAKHKQGIDLLRSKLLSLIGWNKSTAGDIYLARTRHLDAMRKTVKHIDYGFEMWEHLEILAEELRYAHSSLGEITGEFTADDLLGVIFSEFCIGK